MIRRVLGVQVANLLGDDRYAARILIGQWLYWLDTERFRAAADGQRTFPRRCATQDNGRGR